MLSMSMHKHAQTIWCSSLGHNFYLFVLSLKNCLGLGWDWPAILLGFFHFLWSTIDWESFSLIFFFFSPLLQVVVFKQPNYLHNFVQSTFNALSADKVKGKYYFLSFVALFAKALMHQCCVINYIWVLCTRNTAC